MDKASLADLQVRVPKAMLINTEGQDVASKAKKVKNFILRKEDKSNPFQASGQPDTGHLWHPVSNVASRENRRWEPNGHLVQAPYSSTAVSRQMCTCLSRQFKYSHHYLFHLSICPSLLHSGSSYKFWHMGAGSAGCCPVETWHLL